MIHISGDFRMYVKELKLLLKMSWMLAIYLHKIKFCGMAFLAFDVNVSSSGSGSYIQIWSDLNWMELSEGVKKYVQ